MPVLTQTRRPFQHHFVATVLVELVEFHLGAAAETL